MNDFIISIYFLIVLIVVFFLLGLITRNYSHVDRIWSLLPPLYVLYWMKEFYHNPRYVIASLLVILWGVRLTWNFALKGGYSFSIAKGFYGEDYRWAFLRKKISHRIAFEFFNLFFISTFQLTLIFCFTLPLYFLGSVKGPMSSLEIVLFSLHAILLMVEFIADLQQLKYYKRRGDKKYKEDKRVQLGFNTFGLWKYSRHPNYFCEISQWIVISLYLYVNKGLHFSMIGSFVLIFLFVGSSLMAESITISKYPIYGQWKKITSPWFPGFVSIKFQKSKNIFLNDL